MSPVPVRLQNVESLMNVERPRSIDDASSKASDLGRVRLEWDKTDDESVVEWKGESRVEW